MDGHIGNTVQLSTFLIVLNFKMTVLMSNTGQSCKCRIQDHLSELPEEHSYALTLSFGPNVYCKVALFAHWAIVTLNI